ncbi:MAG: exosortase-associated EpsI family protein [Phycisphaerales bacterium]|nr:exosortase-associated EpsI family protein [Phycisphaerales bacterium]NNM25700.1 exosortase-associated EpsI family protein [Phycisphaerales bacterium]
MSGSDASTLFDRHAKVAFIAACVVLAACGIGFRSAVGVLNVYLKKEPVELRDHFATIPSQLGPWELVAEGEKLTAEMVEELGTNLYLDRRYRRADDPDQWLGLHIAYYTGIIDAVPHVPDRCLVAGGFNTREPAANFALPLPRDRWREDPEHRHLSADVPFENVTIIDSITRRPVVVRMPVGETQLRATGFSHKKRPDSRMYAGYFFVANGRIAPTPEAVKMAAFRKSERYAYYCKVQFFTEGPLDFTVDDFVARSADFAEHLLPELMRCLPDWAEVQSRSATTPVASVSRTN